MIVVVMAMVVTFVVMVLVLVIVMMVVRVNRSGRRLVATTARLGHRLRLRFLGAAAVVLLHAHASPS
jgi:hypothetical protein